jgi:hypothetical protein
MNQLSPEARNIFAEAESALDPTEEEVRRMDRRLAAKLGLTALGAGAVTSAATTASASTASAATSAPAGAATAAPVATLATQAASVASQGLLVKALMVTVALVTGGTGATLMLQAATTSAPSTHAPAIGASSGTANAAPGPVLTAPTPAPVVTAVVSAPRVLTGQDLRAPDKPVDGKAASSAHKLNEVPPAPDDSLREEVKLLQEAQAALAGGQPNQALSKTSEHARRFPQGALTEEREGTRAIALCNLGRRTEGRAVAEHLLLASPTSAMASRVQRACADAKE